MGSNNCMNEVCRGTTSSTDWKKGWSLKSGGFAALCNRCGSAYENSVFCETFHLEESGWRECRICGKRIHCGCAASRYLREDMDFGGVGCITCVKNFEIPCAQSFQIPSDVSDCTVSDPKPSPTAESETDRGTDSLTLQQLSGDLKSNIVPLFEKTLSAGDAGRIGRLLLRKACAEMYFPVINQSEGIPIRIQDIEGKEWTFQFRFWPNNNNSRMYVLEGVTPCIQKMQAEAGDTVTFSRIEPGGQLVIGCRKAMNNDSQTPPSSTSSDSDSDSDYDSDDEEAQEFFVDEESNTATKRDLNV